MKKLFFFIFLSFISSCKKDHHSNNDNVIETETIGSESVKTIKPKKETITFQSDTNWQEKFVLSHDIDKDSIWNKPIRFYIDNPKCDKIATNFYFGSFRPSDNLQTAKLLNLVITDNSDLRPFYRWILDKTILIQDGALGEYTGVSARKYAEKFPNEFFEFIDSDKTGEVYENWYNSILYSGFYKNDDSEKSEIIRQNLMKTMQSNCKNCNENMNSRIQKFALDCFPNSEK